MTDVAATRTSADSLNEAAPRLIKMRRFGRSEGSTLPISSGAGVAILALWWIVSELRLVPHLFLPTPAPMLIGSVEPSLRPNRRILIRRGAASLRESADVRVAATSVIRRRS